MVAEEILVRSTTLVAVTVTVCCNGIDGGAGVIPGRIHAARTGWIYAPGDSGR